MENGIYLFKYIFLPDDRYVGVEEREMCGYIKNDYVEIALPCSGPCEPGVEMRGIFQPSPIESGSVKEIRPYGGNRTSQSIIQHLFLGYGYDTWQEEYLKTQEIKKDFDIFPFGRFYGVVIHKIYEGKIHVQFYPEFLSHFINSNPGFKWIGISRQEYKCALPYTDAWTEVFDRIYCAGGNNNYKYLMRND